MSIEVEPTLEKLMQPGKDFLGCEYPILKGAMTWVSEPTLVAAVCDAGGFASLAGGNTPVDILQKQIQEVKKLTDKNFAVNLITISPSYPDHIKMIQEEIVPFVVFAGTIPTGEEIQLVKKTGAKVIAFAPTLPLAKRLVKQGADALIIEGTEAGGHIGSITTTVLLQEILFELRDQVPVFVAGGIGTGKMIAHLMMMGAAGVQMGTRFVLSDECTANEKFKAMFKRGKSRDAVATSQFDAALPIVSVRAIKNQGTSEFTDLQLDLLKKLKAETIEKEAAQLECEKYWMGALRNAAVEGDIEKGSLMAGQSVGLIKKSLPVKDLLEELISDANEEVKLIKAKLA